MKKHILFISILTAALVFAATSCSSHTDDATATFVLSGPASSVRTDATTDGTGSTDATGTRYYYTVTLTGIGYSNAKAGSFNGESAKITFDELPLGSTLTAAVHLFSTTSVTKTITCGTASYTATADVLANAWTGSSTFTVAEGGNDVAITIVQSCTYISAEGSDTTGTGTYTKPYATLAKAVSAKESEGRPAHFNSYTLLTDITVPADGAIAPAYDSYFDLGGHTLTWTNATAAAPLFKSAATLVVKDGIITGGLSFTAAGIVSLAATIVSGKAAYGQSVFETTGTLVLDAVAVPNVFYNGANASVLYAHDGANVMLKDVYAYLCLSYTGSASKGAFLADGSTLSANNLNILSCTGTTCCGMTAKNSTVLLFGGSWLSNTTLSATTTSVGCLSVDGGKATVSNSFLACLSSASGEAALVTGGGQLEMADTVTMPAFNLASFAAEQTTPTATTPSTVMISGTYANSSWTSNSTNTLALGDSSGKTGRLLISGNSIIYGLTYLYEDSRIRQTGTLTATTNVQNSDGTSTTAEPYSTTIDFPVTDGMASFTVFEATDWLDTSYFPLKPTGYAWAAKTSTDATLSKS